MEMVPLELVESIHSNDTVLFIGAGLSIGAGLPSWSDLVRPLAQSAGIRWPHNDADLATNHLLFAAQAYEDQRGRNALIEYLRGKLDTSEIQPTTVHDVLVTLPINTIFTTNYDDLLERSLRQCAKRPNVIVEESELAFWRERNVNLVKLSGDLLRPSSIVITQSDFNTYFRTHSRLAERLRTTLESKISLFLGYSLQDPFFNQIWDHIGLDFGKLRRCGYATLIDPDQLTVDSLQRRGIHTIQLETLGRSATAAFTEWLHSLSVGVNSFSHPPSP